MSAVEHKHHDYHLVDPSPLPIVVAISSVIMFIGLVLTMHGKHMGNIVLWTGLAGVIATMYFWWRDVVIEGLCGSFHTAIVRRGLRIGMSLFILSEVMFFFAFFWIFFHSALDPRLLFEGTDIFQSATKVVQGIWPPSGIQTLDAWDLPLINTMILLLSGCTVTWAHYSLMHDNRTDVIRGLACTVLLGILFTLLQIVEYTHAAFCMNGLFDGLLAKLGLNTHNSLVCDVSQNHIYPSSFFMATGFHGLHVIIGTIFLSICLVRAIRGQFSKEGHLGFEFAAWYWHFVDVVWIFLFVLVYVWGGQ